MEYRAISLHQPWANLVADGKKTIETRFWHTQVRGDLLICSTKNPRVGEGPFGYALCVVELYRCWNMEGKDAEAACIEFHPDRYSWFLRDLRKFREPFPVTGRQGFFSQYVSDEELFL